MTNVKDLMNNEELMKHIVEDLEDFPEDSPVTYEVWALGYNHLDELTDSELLLATFEDPDKAVEYAKQLTLADIVYKASEEDTDIEQADDIDYISVEVETVLSDPDDEFVGGTINIGTVYKKEISIYEDESEDEEEIVSLHANDYNLLDDGNIEVSRVFLINFNKNDRLQIMFADEDNTPILTYKIISETTANTFICEFIY
jgi:hypothetical protein